MSLEGPQLRYARVEDDAAKHVQAEDTLQKALELARELEELLEDTRSTNGVPGAAEDPRAHSTRMARAFAASLVDELAALVRPARHTGSS
jgi:hypothetical protein